MSKRERGEHSRATSLIVLAGVVLIAILAGWGVHWYRNKLPSTEHVFGRDYDRGQDSGLTLRQAEDRQGGSLVVVDHGTLTVGARTQYAPTVIYIEHAGRYWDYALEGGP